MSEAAAITEEYAVSVSCEMLASGGGVDGTVATCRGAHGVTTVDVGGSGFDVRCEKDGRAQVLGEGLSFPAGDLDVNSARVPSRAGWSVTIYAPDASVEAGAGPISV